jgi:tetratricopeptide (TPR) repeat protein
MRSDPFETGGRTPQIASTRYFTDREDAIGAFQRAISAPAGQPLRAMVYYGVGGIGKSALLQHLGEALPDALPHALVDLQSIGDRTVAYRETLLRFRSDLGRFRGLDFPRFDLCLAVMLEREGGDPPPLVRLNPRLSGMLGAVTGLVKAIPGPLSAPAQALESVVKGVLDAFPALQDLIRRNGGMEGFFELRKRAIRDDQTLPADLIRRFAQDLAQHLPERPGMACRGVLFLDTYEHLWAGRDAAASQSQQLDWWVADLIRFCLHERVGILPILASRDGVRWADGDAAWAELLDQYPMGGLGPRDAQSFLARCGIGRAAGAPASPLQEAIVRCCDTKQSRQPSCHPLYLALCVDIVLNTRRATGGDPPLEAFAGIPERRLAAELAARFLTSLHSSSMESWVMDLCVTPRFDEAAALAVDAARQHYNGRAGWERLRQFSFLERQADGFYRLHATMRAALRARLDPDAALEVHRWFSTYWSDREEASLAWCHRWALDPREALFEWEALHTAALKRLRVAEARELLSRWSEIALDDADRQMMGDELWGLTHHFLGAALLHTPVAPRRDPLDAAIGHFHACLLVYTQENSPRLWAGTQNELGSAYAQLPTGDRAENLSRAIACQEAALRVYTEAAFPVQWAGTQINLGLAYADLPTGDRAEHLRRAIACCEAALRVFTEAGFPRDWALAHNNMGIAWTALPAGDRTENLQQAISFLEAALRVYTEADFPREWAMVQANLGVAHTDLRAGDRAEHLHRAIACYEAALRVYTEADFPGQWAAIQNDLGAALSYLPAGDRAQNLRRAIACFEAVLRVHTETDYPLDWADTQNNLGEAYRELLGGSRLDNVRMAVAFHEAALRVHTEATLPAQWAVTQRELARSLLILGELTADPETLHRARAHCVAASRGFISVGLDDEVAGVEETQARIDAALAEDRFTDT